MTQYWTFLLPELTSLLVAWIQRGARKHIYNILIDMTASHSCYRFPVCMIIMIQILPVATSKKVLYWTDICWHSLAWMGLMWFWQGCFPAQREPTANPHTSRPRPHCWRCVPTGRRAGSWWNSPGIPRRETWRSRPSRWTPPCPRCGPAASAANRAERTLSCQNVNK